MQWPRTEPVYRNIYANFVDTYRTAPMKLDFINYTQPTMGRVILLLSAIVAPMLILMSCKFSKIILIFTLFFFVKQCETFYIYRRFYMGIPL